MEQIFLGRISGTQLAHLGNSQFWYGYLTIKAPDDTQIKFKVDHDTACDHFEVGDDVVIDAFTLGNGNLWVVKEIKKVQPYHDRKFVLEEAVS